MNKWYFRKKVIEMENKETEQKIREDERKRVSEQTANQIFSKADKIVVVENWCNL
jgi:prolyl oligopeptidase PreP (S9A serine peptidase family)